MPKSVSLSLEKENYMKKNEWKFSNHPEEVV